MKKLFFLVLFFIFVCPALGGDYTMEQTTPHPVPGDGFLKEGFTADHYILRCPNCGGKQYCPCPSCREHHKQQVVWKWVTPSGPIACWHCGYTMDEWGWLKEEERQWRRSILFLKF